MSKTLDPALREAFAAVADVLIPEAEGMPAASQVGVQDELLDRILSLRSDIREDFMRGVRFAAGRDPVEAANALNNDDPAALTAIGLAASAAYYMTASVRDLIGYPGQERRPDPDPDATPEYVANGMLQQVIDRGPIYKPTPS